MEQHSRPNRTTPLESVWSMAQSDMMVECERFIYFIVFKTYYYIRHKRLIGCEGCLLIEASLISC